MKLTKIAQTDPYSSRPTTKPPPTPRNNAAIAEALVAAAKQLGLDAVAFQTGGEGGFTEYTVACNGRHVTAQAGIPSADVEIIFDIPATGNMTGRVLRGMEVGPADHVMRNVVAGAVRATGMAAQQLEREVNMELCENPGAYKEQQNTGTMQQPQTGVQPNGMA